jgi:hypothetical protein
LYNHYVFCKPLLIAKLSIKVKKHSVDVDVGNSVCMFIIQQNYAKIRALGGAWWLYVAVNYCT